MEGNVFVVYNLGTNDHPLGEISVKVNDNNYHIVRFHRFGHNSTLQIDDYNVQTSHPLGESTIFLSVLADNKTIFVFQVISYRFSTVNPKFK